MLKNGRGPQAVALVSACVMVLMLAGAGYGATRPVVVLDPGHGGEDAGVTGSYGTREKDVALALALELKRQLGLSCDVRLTRESDRGVSVMRRVELANSFHGDLFVSLHAGGGLSRDANRIALFVQREPKGRATAPGRVEGWDGGHRPHIPESQALATVLQRPLALLAGYDGVDYSGVPLGVAKGAGMPAVLIEVGNLTNPREEGRLESPEHLRRVASAVAAGIEAFLQR
ncbi:N-acetylmuramoyl-L-alanine amidase family protein [Desulfoluna spongiiphila]|uniref:N-acetylmuramoyl-L-alanine amidase n=1 Tax=Desulfoluna spongiiphila TaxID=419481 RepID=A0A1G5CL37_9BACT|nr:N-acetylmuramoyl-L-alanine amidase [Desulfoluna spongiiphila]SCY03122.1 N-acetylmuramoyl-L-alanine amidase [Desulfoluna spongiiphila]